MVPLNAPHTVLCTLVPVLLPTNPWMALPKEHCSLNVCKRFRHTGHVQSLSIPYQPMPMHSPAAL